MNGFSSGEKSLPNNAIGIESCAGCYDKQNYEYSFVVKNNTSHKFTSISLCCSLLDEEDSIVGTTYAHLYTTINPGKKATIKATIYDLDPSASKIALDYAYYDTNSDNRVATYYFSSDIVKEYTIEINKTQNVLNNPNVQSASSGEQNALKAALFYIDAIPFSYSGLVKQLQYEGFSQSEAEFAAENCGADWKEQAALRAAMYLDSMGFSRTKLIEQLQYDGFTYEQAVYGVDKSYS